MLKKGSVEIKEGGGLTPEERKSGICLACMTSVRSDIEVEVPEERYLRVEDIQVPAARTDNVFTRSPLARKFYLELPVPTLEDNAGDMERLYAALREASGINVAQTGLSNIRHLSGLLRGCAWKITVTLGIRNDAAAEIIRIEPGDTTAKNHGLCFDIGTTTVCGELVDLNSGKTIGAKAGYNRQIAFGDDVISRIVHAGKKEGLKELQECIVGTVNMIIRRLLAENNVQQEEIPYIVCSGNTTMVHLLLGIDPGHIRKEPYVPAGNSFPVLRAGETGIDINQNGLLLCIPGVSGYVGGDITAGVLSSGIYREEEVCLFIDIGTNGEIVLGSRDFLVACAASAGPAFEGSGVTSGMRAGEGAIQKISINKRDFSISYSVIADKKPLGICGSGYIDLISEMLDSGIIDKNGKFAVEDKRIRMGNAGKEFVVCPKQESGGPCDIVVSEPDLENLKRSKAAIYSATAALAKHLKLDLCGISRIFISGGFGSFLDVEKAVRIGLLPDLERSRFFFIGNSALSGAKQALLSEQAMSTANTLASSITYFELSADPGYMDEYGQALFFPHTELDKFPSLKAR